MQKLLSQSRTFHLLYNTLSQARGLQNSTLDRTQRYIFNNDLGVLNQLLHLVQVVRSALFDQQICPQTQSLDIARQPHSARRNHV
jgi:hypothetical protein